MNASNVLVAGWFPGAMRAVAPLGRALADRGCRVRVLCTDVAAPIAARCGIDQTSLILVAPDSPAPEPVQAYGPEVVVLGIGEGTPPERRLLADCRAMNVPTLGVLDTWGDYARRLGTRERPDVLAVMTDAVRRDVERGGFWPGTQIMTAGHPGLEQFTTVATDETSRADARRSLGLRDDGELLVFFSQPLEQQFRETLGYTQVEALRSLARRLHADLDLLVAAHPREDPTGLAEAADSRGRVISSYDPASVYVASTVVASCFSACLVEAALCRRAVVSIQPGRIGPDRCWASHLGICETVDQEAGIEAAVSRARVVARSLSELERRRQAIGLGTGAVDRLIDVVGELAARHRSAPAVQPLQ